MSGANESKKPSSFTDRLERIRRLLQDFPQEIGIGILKPINETHLLLTMSDTEKRKLNEEECAEASATLNQSAAFVQLKLNSMISEVNWCNKAIDYMLAPVIHNYGGQYTPFEFKRLAAIRDNDVTIQLYDVVIRLELRVDELKYMPNRLHETARAYANLQQVKRKQRA